MTAEAWGLRDGLRLALQLGFSNIIVELDVKVLFDLVWGSVEQIYYLIRFFWITRKFVKASER